MSNSDWVPTARLRWVERIDPPEPEDTFQRKRVFLQQWYSQDVPGYMRRDAEGEWRDVPTVEAAP
jgi:hypothetical protein